MAQNLLDGIGLWADVRCDMPAELGPVLFLDRDGVVIEDRGYVGSAAQTRATFQHTISVFVFRCGLV